jgi:PHD/YefM family antitoxin component YafN of YafNO toxin-antitoxin module
LQALRAAVAKLIEDHRRDGRPLAIWRDGKAVWVSVEEAAAMREAPTPYRTKSHGA